MASRRQQSPYRDRRYSSDSAAPLMSYTGLLTNSRTHVYWPHHSPQYVHRIVVRCRILIRMPVGRKEVREPTMPYQQPPRQRMQHAQGSMHSTIRGAFAGWLRDHVRWALLLLLVFSGILGPISQNGLAFFPTASAHGLSASTPPNPNHLSPSSNTTSVTHPNLGKGTTANAPAGPPQSLKRTGGISMQPGELALAAGHATTFKGSDGRFEIDVPAGAVTQRRRGGCWRPHESAASARLPRRPDPARVAAGSSRSEPIWCRPSMRRASC